MTGHVFHPGHDDLHGVTVILRGSSGRTYVGRWHERGNRGVTMKDVAIHDPASAGIPLDDWLARQRKFGVAASEKHLVVANEEATSVEKL